MVYFIANSSCMATLKYFQVGIYLFPIHIESVLAFVHHNVSSLS